MLKKSITMALVLILLMCIPLNVYASERILAIQPVLTFSGTTANCTVYIDANAGDNISATIKLWYGSTCLKGWNVSGETYINFSDTAPVVSGKTYKLTVDVTVNNVKKPQVSNTQTCP